MSEFVTHGGNIYEAAEDLGLPERKIIDFSASINPLGISKKIKAQIRKHLKYLKNYPDPACVKLTELIAKKYNAPKENILIGNGSIELIYLLVRTLSPQKALIPAPTFSEYERALNINNVYAIKHIFLQEQEGFKLDIAAFAHSMSDTDIAFLCNPNNPTATYLNKNDIATLSKQAKENNCFLVIDEAFLDFLNQDSAIELTIDNPKIIVLRSLTKFYALSGLRIGFAVCNKTIKDKLLSLKEPWTVNSLAQIAARTALKDNIYEKQTFDILKKEKTFIEQSLNKYNIHYYPSKINFYLIKHEIAHHLYLELRKKGILLRDCSNYKGLDQNYIRIAVKNHRENTILMKEIKRLLH
ncbi:L-threonine-O-3-phosphate decarboxylase [Candidatus Magnetoovum chiemensis]|nr:L-threonine-O-3-phosphate decarboxylase [Candidatus Magnetoovum chiemensis]